jgi:DNA-binding transcriptional LysR family regulator
MNIEALRDFLAVIEAGGITAGAARRGSSKQSVSRRLMALEQQLGVRIIDRSKRALRLTPEGEILKERAQRILSDLADTQRLFADATTSPEGLLRISAPHLLGQTLLGGIIGALLEKHPGLQIEAVLSDNRVDLVEEGFDAAIRVGNFEDSTLISRLVSRAQTILVASPMLVAKWGTPASPSDLEGWPAIIFGVGKFRTRWRLSDGKQEQIVELNARLCASSIQLCVDSAIAGAGAAIIPAFLAAPLVDSGKLVRILPQWQLPHSEIRIVFPTRRLMSPRLRVFIDEAKRQLQEVPFG